MSTRTKILTLAFAGLLCLAGCKVQFIAPYDESLDTSMTKVQNDSELFFTRLADAGQTDAGSYDSVKSYYLQTEATLHTMLTRAQATPKSEVVADQILTIEHSVETIQSMHERDKFLIAANLKGDRETLEDEFQQFFKLELALKSGSGATKPAAAAKKK